MKRILMGMGAVLTIVLLLLMANEYGNEHMIDRYQKHHYEENQLAMLGILQPYIAPYNLGNVYYQRGEYEQAVESYRKALSYQPPEGADCMIRINLVLAKLVSFDPEKVTLEEYDDAINMLREAQEILCLNGCAHMEDNKGHNEDAQELKEDIDEVIEELGVPITLIKTDENGEPLSGAALQVQDIDGNMIYEWESDGTPYTNIRFRIGESYIYHEEEAPSGYQQAEDIIFTINEDGSVSYEKISEAAKEGAPDEVIMVDQKPEEQEGGGGGEQPEPQQEEENEGSTPQEQLEGLQQQTQMERTEEINEDQYLFDYEYYTGEIW